MALFAQAVRNLQQRRRPFGGLPNPQQNPAAATSVGAFGAKPVQQPNLTPLGNVGGPVGSRSEGFNPQADFETRQRQQQGGYQAVPFQPVNMSAESSGLTPFGPGQDLRGTQISPAASARLGSTTNLVNQAAAGLGNAPNLQQAGQGLFQNLLAETGRQRQLGTQQIGQDAARLGRLGSGMVTTSLGNLEDVLQQRQLEAARGLSSDLALRQGAEQRANLGALSGLESQQYGQEAGARGELRGERGYQQDLAQQALMNRLQQQMLQDALLNSQFGRQAGAAQLGLQGAGILGQQGAENVGAAGDLLQQMALQKAAGGAMGGLPPGASIGPEGPYVDEQGRLIDPRTGLPIG